LEAQEIELLELAQKERLDIVEIFRESQTAKISAEVASTSQRGIEDDRRCSGFRGFLGQVVL